MSTAAQFWNPQQPQGGAAPESDRTDAADFWAQPSPEKQQADALRQSVAYGATQNPDEYAKLLAQAAKTGIAPALAKDFQPELKQAVTLQSMDFDQFVANAPRTAAWASNPDNAAVAGQDELDRLAAIEAHSNTARLIGLTDVQQAAVDEERKRVFEQHAGINRASDTGSRAAGEVNSASASILSAFLSPFLYLENSVGSTLENLLDTLKVSASKGAGDPYQKLQAIWSDPHETLTSKAVGDTQAMLDSWIKQGPRQYLTDANGQTFENPDYAWYGRNLVNAVEGVPGGVAAFMLGGAVTGSAKAMPALMALQRTQQGYAEAKDAGASTGTALLASGLQGAATYGFMAGLPAGAPSSSISGTVAQWAARSAVLGLGMTMTDNAAARLYDPNRDLFQGWQQSVATMAAYEGLGAVHNILDVAQQSALKARSEEKFREAVASAVQGTPYKDLRVPVEAWDSYFESKQMDPARVAEQVGVSRAYAEAQAGVGGDDLVIPTADLVAKLGNEHLKGLQPDIRGYDQTGNPTATPRQIAEFFDAGGMEKLAAEMQQADAETQASPEWKSVYSDLKQRYVAAGETEPVAEHSATLQANALTNLARRAGMQPAELLALHEPKITMGEVPENAAAAARPLYQQAIDDIRSVVEGAKQPGHAQQKAVIGPAEPWLVDAAKEHGLDIADHRHVIDGSAVRHVVSRHGDQKIETSRGQLAVTDADFERIPDLIAAPDAVVFGTKTKGKRDQVGYIKRQEDGSALYLEEVRTGKKELAAVSMRKYPAAKDFDSIAGTLPSNARSDGGNSPIVVLRPNVDKGILYQSGKASKRTNLEVARIQGEILKGEPWQQTFDEYKASRKGQRIDKFATLNREGTLQRMHGDQVSLALQAGKAVPQKVLEELVARNPYTDIAKQAQAELEARAARTADQPRGWFRILPDGRFEIGKTSIGDLSTFVHEPSHAYLELFRELTQREGASEPLKDDFRKITEWLGTTPEEAYKNGFTRAQHEQWARANELYVREGKAPTAGLRRAFHNFAVWLGKIYVKASSLGVEINPEIRGVMDRLYAGEEAVNRAETEAGLQTFGSPEEAGWTDAEYQNWAEAKGIALDKAREHVRAEMNAAAEREGTQAWREERNNVREAATQQIDMQREYVAIRSLRRGALDDGTALTLNREALVKQFGEERVAELQRQHRGLYRLEGGADPETAAEILGFRSADEMLRALTEAPRRSKAIDAATQETMTARHGDIRYDGTLDDKARVALENDDRARGLHQELAALRRRVKQLEKRAADNKAALASITIAPLESYQAAAHQMMEQNSPADIQPHRYLDASRKYSREAFDALRKGKVERAADAKHKELLNHFLFREATQARDYLGKFEKYVKQSVQSKGIQQRLALAGSDFRAQYNWLVARYAMGPAPAEGMPERPLRDWAQEQFDNGSEPAIAPGILDDRQYKDYRNRPLSEIRELHDALLNIRAIARQQFEMFVQGKKIVFAEGRAAMEERARQSLRSKPELTFEHNRSALDRAADTVRYVDARLVMVERVIEWLDGGKAGPWHDNIWNPIADAQGDEDALQHEVTRTVMEAIEKMPPELRRRLWTEKVSVDGISEPVTRRDIVSMAFNMGNEGNLDRLKKTFEFNGWDPDAIRRIGGMLTREEWQFVQGVWDALKPLGQRANELTKRLTGLPLEMVKVTPFTVALDDGTEIDLEGGYYPIVYDPKHVVKGYDEEAAKTAQNAMQAGYVRATTSKGYTKERTGSAGPLLLDYEKALTSHVAKVTKDLSHREAMLSTQRFLLDPQLIATLRETIGPKYEEQLMPWLRAIINDNNGSVQERLDSVKDLMQRSRANFVTAALSFNPGTVLLQISHAPRMLLYARPASLAQAFVDLLARPVEATREIRELSPNEMRSRGDHLDRDLRGVLQKAAFGGYARKVAVAGRFALQMMDHLLSHTLWRAAFNEALVKYADLPAAEAQKKAVYEADSAIRLGLGAHAPKDLPAIMRNNEFNKFITTLYGFHNGVYNQFRDLGHQARYDRKIGKLTYGVILSAVVPAVLGSWLTGRRPEDDENAGWWAAKRSLLFAADTVPVVRSVASAMEGGRDVQFSPIENVLTKGAKAGMEALSSKEDKDWLGIGLNEGEAIGDLLGVPGTHQATKTLRYIKRAHEGKIEDPGVWGAIVGGGKAHR